MKIKSPNIQRIPIILIVITVVLLGCAKKQQSKPTSTGPDAKTLALASGTWKITAWEAKHKDGSWLKLVLTDDRATYRITYDTDHTYTASGLYQGTMRNYAGTWKFANNESVVVFGGEIVPGEADSTAYSIITPTMLQEKEFDVPAPYTITLYPETTGSATDTTFYGLRTTYGH